MMHDDNNDEPYLFYIKGNRFSLQIDAGNSPKSYKQFEKLLEEEETGVLSQAALETLAIIAYNYYIINCFYDNCIFQLL